MKIAVSPSKGAIRPVLVGGAFEQPQRGRADRDDAAAGGAGRVEAGGRFRRDPAPFGVHDMVFVSSALTGRKVPAPTWRVSVSWPIPAAASAAIRPG